MRLLAFFAGFLALATAVSAHNVQEGAPGVYGDSPTDIYYDNVTVKVNE